MATLLLLAACEQEAGSDASQLLRVGHYFESGGRGRLCVLPGDGPQRAVFITFGKSGQENCSASGTLQGMGSAIFLVPKGEGDCRIPLKIEGDKLQIGTAPPACSYYCGPGVSLGGQSFNWADTSTAEVEAEPLLPGDEAC